MSKKDKKKKPLAYVTYNKKEFLAPNCIKSMSAIHTKIYPDGTGIIRISDCHNSIKIWNDIGDKKEVVEFVDKINTMINSLNDFRNELMSRHGHQHFFSAMILEPEFEEVNKHADV
jgi:hypothetical protein